MKFIWIYSVVVAIVTVLPGTRAQAYDPYFPKPNPYKLEGKKDPLSEPTPPELKPRSGGPCLSTTPTSKPPYGQNKPGCENAKPGPVVEIGTEPTTPSSKPWLSQGK